jgi:hypothetical protein
MAFTVPTRGRKRKAANSTAMRKRFRGSGAR